MSITNNKKEMFMTAATITVGRRLIPVERIALVEAFDPAANPNFRSDKPYKGRVVLIDRESVLIEMEPFVFAEKNAFRMVLEDNVATNPHIAFRFSVETFEKVEGFNPTKPYRSRLVWRDLDGNTQSKLMLTEPEILLAVAIRGEALRRESPEAGEAVPSGGRRRTRRKQQSLTAG
jgi:hypothetical protein